MKKLILFCLILGFSTSLLIAQQNTTGAKFKFALPNLNLGTINIEDLELSNVDIKFTNEGNQPLIISGVRGCCGTRIVEYPTAPILPGKEGIIKIQYRLPAREHRVSRTITVVSNDPDSPSVFNIIGEVVDKSTAPGAPGR
jgi:hypothetical protein